MKNSWWAPLAIVVLTPFYYLVPWERSPSVALWTGVPLLLLYNVLLPGWILSDRWALRRTDVLEKSAAALVIGFSYFFVVAFLCVVAGMSLSLFAELLPAAIVAIAAVGFATPPSPDPLVDVPPARGDRALLVGFATLLVVTLAVVLRAGMPVQFFKDSLDHVAYVAETAERHQAFPTTAFYFDPGPNGEDIRKGFMHVFYGYGVAYLGVETLPFLNAVNGIFTVALLLVVYSTAVLLFRSRAVAVLSAIVFLLAIDGGLRTTIVRQSFYPHRFAIVFFFYVVVHGLRYLEHPRRRDLAFAAVFAFAACAAHVLFALLIAFAGLSIVVWKFCFPQNRAKVHTTRVLAVALAAATGMLPICLFRYLTDFPQPNELHSEVQGVVFLTRSLFVADPLQLTQWLGPIGLASLLTVIPLWRARARYPILGYVFATFLMLFFVLFNPLLLPPLRSAITYLIARLNNMCLFYFAAAFFLVTMASSRHERRNFGVIGKITAVLLAAGILNGLWIAVSDSTLSAKHLRQERQASYLLYEKELAMLDSKLPPHSVIVSDPMTSYAITAFTTHYTVCTLDQHAPPNDLRLAERMQDARSILGPDVPMHRTVELLTKHHAKYLVLNDRFPPGLLLEYWVMDRSIFPWTREKFAAHPELFTTVYERDDFVVFEWNGNPARVDSSYVRPSVVDRLPSGFTALEKQAGEAVLEGFALEKQAVARGGELGVRLVWSGDRRYSLGNWVVAVRFDYADLQLPFGGRPAPKVLRKIKEKLIGARYRFREEHKIRSGFLSPDTWQPGDLILDATRVRVPTDLVPGDYRVSVKLLKVEHQPTYRLSDLFLDEDTYQGIAVTRVRIE